MIRSFRGQTPQIAASAFISEAAYVVGNISIGENVGVFPGAVLRGDFGCISIGDNCIIEDNCVIHSGSGLVPGGDGGDIRLGRNVQVGHGAVINCKSIGDNVLIGMNATVLHEAVIGEGAVIGAACLVTQGMQVPAKTLVLGVPGRIKGTVTQDHSWWTAHGADYYRPLVSEYKAEGL
jgi:carbonic anhydrase/acetyltransferase-like protein (isoleucine patch superfamily)